MAYKAGKSKMHSQEMASKKMGTANPSMAFPKGANYSASWPLKGKGKSPYCPKLQTFKSKK